MNLNEKQADFLTKFVSKDYAKILATHRATLLNDLTDAAVAARAARESGDTNVRGLEDMLARTGRTANPDDTSADQTARKAALASDILQMEENANNAHKIATYYHDDGDRGGLSRLVKPEDWAAARQSINTDMSLEDMNIVIAAREKMAARRATAETVQAGVEAETKQALRAALGDGAEAMLTEDGGVKLPKDLTADQKEALQKAKLAALTKVAKDTYETRRLDDSGAFEFNLAHNISRHGPETTFEDHVIRIATSHPPDARDPDVGDGDIAQMQTADGKQVNVPLSQQAGEDASGASSWMGDPVTNLQIIEEAIAQAHLAQTTGFSEAGGQIDYRTGAQYVNTLTGETRAHDVTGSSAYTMRNAADQGIAADGVTPLTPASDLAPLADPADNRALIEERVGAIHSKDDVKGAKVVMKSNADGTLRTITSYPNEGPQGQSVITAGERHDPSDFNPANRDIYNAIEANKARLNALSNEAGGINQTRKNRSKKPLLIEKFKSEGALKKANGTATRATEAQDKLIPAEDPAKTALEAVSRAVQLELDEQHDVNGLIAQADEIARKIAALERLNAVTPHDSQVAFALDALRVQAVAAADRIVAGDTRVGVLRNAVQAARDAASDYADAKSLDRLCNSTVEMHAAQAVRAEAELKAGAAAEALAENDAEQYALAEDQKDLQRLLEERTPPISAAEQEADRKAQAAAMGRLFAEGPEKLDTARSKLQAALDELPDKTRREVESLERARVAAGEVGKEKDAAFEATVGDINGAPNTLQTELDALSNEVDPDDRAELEAKLRQAQIRKATVDQKKAIDTDVFNAEDGVRALKIEIVGLQSELAARADRQTLLETEPDVLNGTRPPDAAAADQVRKEREALEDQLRQARERSEQAEMNLVLLHREQALTDALMQSEMAYADAVQDWQAEIEAVEHLNADDAKMRLEKAIRTRAAEAERIKTQEVKIAAVLARMGELSAEMDALDAEDDAAKISNIGKKIAKAGASVKALRKQAERDQAVAADAEQKIIQQALIDSLNSQLAGLRMLLRTTRLTQSAQIATGGDDHADYISELEALELVLVEQISAAS